jgi:hypothetical protein
LAKNVTPKREKPTKITNDLLKTKAFRKIRQEWANERWAGLRKKKAEEASKKDQ